MSAPTTPTAQPTATVARIGRPPRFNSPEEMQAKVDAYFADCDKADRPYTVPGLTLALGFSSRTSLHNYTYRNIGCELFANTIKMAKFRIEVQRAEALVMCKGNPAGIIFDLKNNFGWRDQKAVELNGTNGESLPVDVELTKMPPEPKDMAEWVECYTK